MIRLEVSDQEFSLLGQALLLLSEVRELEANTMPTDSRERIITREHAATVRELHVKLLTAFQEQSNPGGVVQQFYAGVKDV